MLFEQILFFVAGAGAVTGALGVVLLRNTFYSVLALVGHLISLAVLFLLLRAEFIAAAQVVVYAGAVMVLYVFVTAYVGGSDQPLERDASGLVGRIGPLFALAVFIELGIAVVGSSLGAVDSRGADVGPGFGSPGRIGELLLQKFLIPFEAASFLLLVAAVAAVVLARRRRGLDDGEADGSPRAGRLPQEMGPGDARREEPDTPRPESEGAPEGASPGSAGRPAPSPAGGGTG